MPKAANSTNGTVLVFCTKHHEGWTLWTVLNGHASMLLKWLWELCIVNIRKLVTYIFFKFKCIRYITHVVFLMSNVIAIVLEIFCWWAGSLLCAFKTYSLFLIEQVRPMKKLPNTVLHERVKVLGEQRPDSVFQGLKPIASPDELYVQHLFTPISYV